MLTRGYASGRANENTVKDEGSTRQRHRPGPPLLSRPIATPESTQVIPGRPSRNAQGVSLGQESAPLGQASLQDEHLRQSRWGSEPAAL